MYEKIGDAVKTLVACSWIIVSFFFVGVHGQEGKRHRDRGEDLLDSLNIY